MVSILCVSLHEAGVESFLLFFLSFFSPSFLSTYKMDCICLHTGRPSVPVSQLQCGGRRGLLRSWGALLIRRKIVDYNVSYGQISDLLGHDALWSKLQALGSTNKFFFHYIPEYVWGSEGRRYAKTLPLLLKYVGWKIHSLNKQTFVRMSLHTAEKNRCLGPCELGYLPALVGVKF